MNLDPVLLQIFERWKSAFDDLIELDTYRNKVVEYKLSGYQYDLSDYTPRQWQPKKKRVNELDNDLEDCKYGLDSTGLPVFTTAGHLNEGQKGFYRYLPDKVEYVQFNMKTGIPSAIEQVDWKDNRKVATASIRINGGGGFPIFETMSREAIIAWIEKDRNSIMIIHTSYEYKGDYIVSSHSVSSYPGSGERRYRSEYKYNTAGELDEIRDFFENGSSVLAYVRPEAQQDPEMMIERLAACMADKIVAALLGHTGEQPLATVHLVYQYVGNYWPYLDFRTEPEQKLNVLGDPEHIFFELFLTPDKFIDVAPAGCEWLFKQFEQWMDKTSDYKKGTQLLRRVAFMLTTSRLLGKIPVTQEFVAYALDASIEGHGRLEFQTILRECGLEPAVVDAWTARGWLGDEMAGLKD